jgi:dTDP-4-amino-4,6-dideoxygalactose transaminase
MEVPFVDLKRQYISIKTKIDTAIQSVVDQTSFIGGDIVTDFEKQFAEYIGCQYAIGCANGTDAIEIALEALGIGSGDEVLVPAYTWVSTASAVQRVGAIPVFVDVHPDFYTIDPDLIPAAISAKTKAIIPVHFYGLAAPMEEIMAIAKSHKLFVIEDCAQAHGATIGKQKVGSFGDLATFSFYPGKNLGAYGDGGAILTNNTKLADRCSIIARLGQSGKHNHLMAGRNSRLDTLQASVLTAKLPYLDEWTAKRRWVARQYNIAFDDIEVKHPRIPNDFKHVYHLYVIQADNRDELKQFLAKKGVQTQLHYPKPLNQFDFFEKAGPKPVSDAMASRLLSLPMFPEMTQAEVNYVIEQVKKFVSFGAR